MHDWNAPGRRKRTYMYCDTVWADVFRDVDGDVIPTHGVLLVGFALAQGQFAV